MQPSLSPYARYLSACRSGLKLYIRLGSPRYTDCRSVGICEVMLTESTCGCPDLVTAHGRIDEPTGRLLLHLETATLNPDLRRRHFSEGSFRVEQAYLLPIPITEALGLDSRYRIAAGTYPTLEDEGLIVLSLRLATALYVEPRLRRMAA